MLFKQNRKGKQSKRYNNKGKNSLPAACVPARKTVESPGTSAGYDLLTAHPTTASEETHFLSWRVLLTSWSPIEETTSVSSQMFNNWSWASLLAPSSVGFRFRKDAWAFTLRYLQAKETAFFGYKRFAFLRCTSALLLRTKNHYQTRLRPNDLSICSREILKTNWALPVAAWLVFSGSPQIASKSSWSSSKLGELVLCFFSCEYLGSQPGYSKQVMRILSGNSCKGKWQLWNRGQV